LRIVRAEKNMTQYNTLNRRIRSLECISERFHEGGGVELAVHNQGLKRAHLALCHRGAPLEKYPKPSKIRLILVRIYHGVTSALFVYDLSVL